MAARAIKRRPNNSDADKGKEEQMETSISDAQSEPLLGNDTARKQSKIHDPKRCSDFWESKRWECLHWANLISHFFAQSARRIANFVSSFGTFIGKLFSRSSANQQAQSDKKFSIYLSPLQEERLRHLRQRVEVPFDGSSVDHQDALKQLWMLAYPNRELPPLKSELWKEMGWQGSDPSTDFRGGGFISLENLIYFAKHYPDSFHRLLHKEDGVRSEWEYPFAAGGINISYMLIQMLDLQSGKLTSKAGARFVELLGGDDLAFDNLYCVAFQMLDRQWLAKRATYMEFNEVLKSTRMQLEQELSLEGISCVRDMPAYRMLSFTRSTSLVSPPYLGTLK
ncbi:ELMO domain-containing protein C-like isoform X1 [Ananas comosus]|uniref:ELMO domain-containing protein C-like isoform X1 n=1 Tax=Ananas comosus TaxID=4615 RepID=A0A6P5FZT1_ANACO|nr:ELMO domain-containing protein C-like isoform X1 [Ananas comosus]XP_020101586.1 ELMO domain-containing protein C-like isoform X1 [Ananas comosus]